MAGQPRARLAKVAELKDRTWQLFRDLKALAEEWGKRRKPDTPVMVAFDAAVFQAAEFELACCELHDTAEEVLGLAPEEPETDADRELMAFCESLDVKKRQRLCGMLAQTEICEAVDLLKRLDVPSRRLLMEEILPEVEEDAHWAKVHEACAVEEAGVVGVIGVPGLGVVAAAGAAAGAVGGVADGGNVTEAPYRPGRRKMSL